MRAEYYNENISLIEPGMSPEEVTRILSAPHQGEVCAGIDGKPPTVYFYYKKATEPFQGEIRKENISPFVFNGDRLEGWGWEYFDAHIPYYYFVIQP